METVVTVKRNTRMILNNEAQETREGYLFNKALVEQNEVNGKMFKVAVIKNGPKVVHWVLETELQTHKIFPEKR